MESISQAQAAGTEGIHAESRVRDSSFVMTGSHCHTCFELFYVENGECRFLIDDHIFDLHTGDFILVPPMSLHYTRYVFGVCKRTVILFRLEDVSEEIRQHLPQGDAFFTHSSIFQVPEAYRNQIQNSLRQMISEEKINDDRSHLIRKLVLQGVLLLCSRVCIFPSKPPVEIHTTDYQLLQAANYINAHYMNPLSTSEVAQAVGFSPNYLSRKFRTAAGIGLHEYIVFVRLHHAAEELISTNDSITTIALRCGYSDSNYFKDSFKKKYGVTPRAYRKRFD